MVELGSIVLYNEGEDKQAAIVTKVHDGSTVDLAVFGTHDIHHLHNIPSGVSLATWQFRPVDEVSVVPKGTPVDLTGGKPDTGEQDGPPEPGKPQGEGGEG